MVFISNMIGWFFIIFSFVYDPGSITGAVCLVSANVWFAASNVIIAINRR